MGLLRATCARGSTESNPRRARSSQALADLVILERNPLKVEPMTIKDIKVLETIKKGKTIYAAR